MLTSQRLSIREFELTDAAFILRLLNQDSFLKYIGDKQVRSLEDAREYLISGPIASYQERGYGPFIVLLAQSNTPIGMCGLFKRDELAYPDLGFAFLPEYCGKGFAFEASKTILDAVSHKGYQSMILAVTLPSNTSSNKLLKRLGFLLREKVRVYGKSNNLYEYKGKPRT